MSFINAEVDVASLPAAENVSLRPVHPSYLKLLRIEWLITTAVLLLTATAAIVFIPVLKKSFWGIMIGATVIIFSAVYFLVQEKAFPFLRYAVREKDVIHQRGWLIRTLKICPFNRIQHCSVETGPLERKFGLASLTLYTAGAEGADLSLSGLPQDEADALRQYVLSKINGEPGTRD